MQSRSRLFTCTLVSSHNLHPPLFSSFLALALAMHRLSGRSSSAVRRAAKSAKPVLARGAHKEIKFSNEGRASILAGVDVLAKAVRVMLGPKGK